MQKFKSQIATIIAWRRHHPARRLLGYLTSSIINTEALDFIFLWEIVKQRN